MLAKLLKYEIPVMGRKLIPLYIAWAATAIILGFTMDAAETGGREGIIISSAILYGCTAIAVLVMSIVLIVQRYSNSLLGDEAYFNQVLPVSASMHIANKLISTIIWLVITVLVAFVTGVIIVLAGTAAGTLEWSNWEINIPVEGWIDLLMLFPLIIASTAKSVMQIYAAITIGHQASNHTTLASIGAYIGILMFEAAVALITNTSIPNAFGVGVQINNQINTSAEFRSVFWIAMAITAAFVALYFFICKYLMEKRLNLA